MPFTANASNAPEEPPAAEAHASSPDKMPDHSKVQHYIGASTLPYLSFELL